MRSRSALEVVNGTKAAEPAGVFYGWVVTWTAFAILAMTYGVQFSFGVLLPDIVEDTGWSRTELSFAISTYIFVYSSLSGLSGSLTDRSGPRRVVVLGAGFLCAGYVLTGLSQERWQFLVSLGLVAAIGMSATFVPCTSTVARWFDRSRGKALGITTSGGSFGGIVVPPIAGLLTTAIGWRRTYVVLAVVTLALLLVASRLIVRDPSVKGLSVDGRVEVASTDPDATGVARASWGMTRAQAMATPVFWAAGGIFFFSWMAVFMPLVHLVPFAEDIGMGKGIASTMLSAIGLGGLLGRTSTGVLSDRIGRLWALALVLAVQISAFAAFAIGTGLLVLLPAAVAFGMAYGGTTTMFPAIFSDQFGQAHIGSITGAVFAVAGSSAAFGPTLAGVIHDATDSYRLAFAIGGGMNLVALGLVGLLWMFLGRSAPGEMSIT